MSTPQMLSVVVVRFAGGDCVRSTLDALQMQTGLKELIVAHGPRFAPDDQLRADYPFVQWVAARTDDPAQARAVGVRFASGAIIACTEDHCTPVPAWASTIVSAHQRTRAVAIGGPIAKRQPDGAPEWAAYLMEYGRYMPPLPTGPASSCSDCNVSYKRDALRAIEHTWVEVFRETSVHSALRAGGGELECDAAMLVQQSRPINTDTFLDERYEHGMVYGAQRGHGANPAARLVMACKALLIPVVFFLRARGAAKRVGPVPAGTFRILWRASVAWARGELRGVLGGTASARNAA